MDSSWTVDDLKQLIVSSLEIEGLSPDSIQDDQPLFGDGLGLDSVDALELIVALEKKLGVKIRSDEIRVEDFATAASMFRFAEQQRIKAEGAVD